MAACREVPERVLGYDSMIGAASFRRQLAALLGRRVYGRAVEPGAGRRARRRRERARGAVLRARRPRRRRAGADAELRRVLARPRGARRAAHRAGAHGERRRLPPDAGAARPRRSPAGRPVRALLLTSPDNPLGRVYTPAELGRLLDWAAARRAPRRLRRGLRPLGLRRPSRSPARRVSGRGSASGCISSGRSARTSRRAACAAACW